jgi:hypothetical protein
MDDLIEQTIKAVGIPPGMQERARRNLKQKNEDEIKAILNRALERRVQTEE